MKNTSKSSRNTFSKFDNEKMIVSINACSPWYLFNSLRILEIRKILNTLANCGPTLNISTDPEAIYDNQISNKLDRTTKKSKLFQLELKYLLPKAISFKAASVANMKVKTRFI